MSQSSQSVRRRLRPFEQAPRPLVGYAIDYEAGNDTGWHQHPRAQLLHAIEGVLRVETEAAQFVLPPGTGLWMPARMLHITRMPAGLRMRALSPRADAARAGPGAVMVVAISPLLRELILAAHAEAAGASERTLARLFRRETGMTFQQWRRQLRLTEGLGRLGQGETPPRAAAAVGYASSPAFGAAYRAAFGTTPGRTRRARRGGE